MGIISLPYNPAGTDARSISSLMGNLNTIVSEFNGNIDNANIKAAAGISASKLATGVTATGKSIIATSEGRTNVAYGKLTTPDQVTGLVMPSSGLFMVMYQAMWQETVQGASRAAIFLHNGTTDNQAKVTGGTGGPVVEEAYTGSPVSANIDRPLATTSLGLVSHDGGNAATADVTTGQIVGAYWVGNGATGASFKAGSSSVENGQAEGGPCFIFAAAGTYTVSVQFLATSGTVTVKDRKLWVAALTF